MIDQEKDALLETCFDLYQDLHGFRPHTVGLGHLFTVEELLEIRDAMEKYVASKVYKTLVDDEYEYDQDMKQQQLEEVQEF